MSTEYYAFTNRREAVGGGSPLHGIRPGDSNDLARFLAEGRFEYPFHLLFREDGEDRWSFATIVPTIREEEAGEGLALPVRSHGSGLADALAARLEPDSAHD